MKNTQKRRILTIGHSNQPIATLIQHLQMHQVTTLADVRSHPYSRYLPDYSKAALEVTLPKAGIRYLFLGHQLGARPTDADCYDQSGKALYEKIAATEQFAEGIEQLLQRTKSEAIALMCAEKDPLTCHRAILICQHLDPSNVEIHHIHTDGSLESHMALEDRLLTKHGFEDSVTQSAATQLSLFAPQRTREDCLQSAYRLQAAAIAYQNRS